MLVYPGMDDRLFVPLMRNPPFLQCILSDSKGGMEGFFQQYRKPADPALFRPAPHSVDQAAWILAATLCISLMH